MDEHNEGRILEKLGRMHTDIGKIEQHLKDLNGRVGKDEVRLAVIENWRQDVDLWRREYDSAAKKTGEEVTDLKVEIAKMAALGGGVGVVVTLGEIILKLAGIV